MSAMIQRDASPILAKTLQWTMITSFLAVFVYAFPFWSIAVGCLVYMGMRECRE